MILRSRPLPPGPPREKCSARVRLPVELVLVIHSSLSIHARAGPRCVVNTGLPISSLLIVLRTSWNIASGSRRAGRWGSAAARKDCADPIGELRAWDVAFSNAAWIRREEVGRRVDGEVGAVGQMSGITQGASRSLSRSSVFSWSALDRFTFFVAVGLAKGVKNGGIAGQSSSGRRRKS